MLIGLALDGVDCDRERQPERDRNLPGGAVRGPAGARLSRLVFSPLVQDLLDRYPGLLDIGYWRLPATRDDLLAFLADRVGLSRPRVQRDRCPAGERAAAARRHINAVEEALDRFAGLTLGAVADALLEVRATDRVSYVLILSLEFALAAKRTPGLRGKHPAFPRLGGGLLQAVTMLAEMERLQAILIAVAERIYDRPDVAEPGRRLDLNTLVAMLDGSEPGLAVDLAQGGAARTYVEDMIFHVEPLGHCLFSTPLSMSADDPVYSLLDANLGFDLKAGLSHRSVAPHRAQALRGTKHAQTMRQARALRPRPRHLDHFYGLDLLDVATIGLREICTSAEDLGHERMGEKKRLSREGAFWTLLATVLANAVPATVDRLEQASNRGRKAGNRPQERVRGGSRLGKRVNDLMRVWLPPHGEPLSASRFDPELWLQPERDAGFWLVVQTMIKVGSVGPIDRIPPMLRSSISYWLNTLSAWFGTLQTASQPSKLTARIMAHLFTSVMPLTTDPLLVQTLAVHSRLEDVTKKLRKLNMNAGNEGWLERRWRSTLWTGSWRN